jgi:hypothetical protein
MLKAHRLTKTLMLLSVMFASQQAEANPPQEGVPEWVTAEAGPSNACPLSAAAGTASNPFFGFNGTTGAPDFHCRETGPFTWSGKTWFVQRIHSLTTAAPNPMCTQAGFSSPCLFDGTRACSAQASPGSPTPAGSAAGGKKCGVYTPSQKFRKKP